MLQETGSPPPDERSFVDDDGTEFVWDVQLRKFRPTDLSAAALLPGTVAEPGVDGARAVTAGAAAAAPGGVAEPAASAAAPSAAQIEYTAEMMRFQGNEDKVVSLEEARADEAASEALAEKLAEAREQGIKVRCFTP